MAKDITGEISATACSLEYKWVIDYDCLSGKNVGYFLKSPVFTTVNVGNSCQWQLRLYPNGADEETKNFFSIFLFLLSDYKLKLQAIFKIIDNKGEVVKKKVLLEETVFKYNKSNGWGFDNLIKRDFIEKNKTGADKLTVVCEIIVLENEEQKNILRMDVCNEHKKLAVDFEQLIDDKEFGDVNFMIENKELRSHKSILSKRSPVFAAMFHNEMRERHENKVEITDVKYEVFQEMLRYVYAEKVNGIEKIAGELLAAADKYSLDGLKLMCEKSLSNVNADNVLETLRLADQHSIDGLKAKCIELIVTKAASIVDKPEFRLLPYHIVCDVCSALANKKK